MSRKGQAPKRDVLPDPVYDSKLITKLINNIMLDGKKGHAQQILYDAFEYIKNQTKEEPKEVFDRALANIMPNLELKVRRIGGSNYQIPIEVAESRKQVLALR